MDRDDVFNVGAAFGLHCMVDDPPDRMSVPLRLTDGKRWHTVGVTARAWEHNTWDVVVDVGEHLVARPVDTEGRTLGLPMATAVVIAYRVANDLRNAGESGLLAVHPECPPEMRRLGDRICRFDSPHPARRQNGR